MAGMTTPVAAAPRSLQALGITATTPMASRFGAPSGEAAPAVASGVATQYWVELIAYPPGSARSLWLFVDGVWRRYDNSPAHWEDMVQHAFSVGQTVQVWYDNDVIVGLVVNN